MKEVEAKILEVNRTKIERKLTQIGARKVFDDEIETLFLDFREGSIVKAKNLLRLRKEGNKTELTFKKVHKTPEVKVAQEYTVEVSDLEMTKKILKFLGLLATESIRKHRTSYTFEKARFDIDKYEGDFFYIPEFIEIEAETAEDIHKYAQLLGFGSKDCLPWNTQDIIKYYSKKQSSSK